jgi:hypothetical protein
MILVIVTKYFRVRVRVSVLKNTHMILVIETKYFRVRVRVSVLKNTQMILVIVKNISGLGLGLAY